MCAPVLLILGMDDTPVTIVTIFTAGYDCDICAVSGEDGCIIVDEQTTVTIET